MRRPGVNVPNNHFIANTDEIFWNEFYRKFTQSFCLMKPTREFEDNIKPFFGHFGFRWHPVASRPHYYHMGIDVHLPVDTPIFAIYDGLLDYSGYAPVNGNYIIIRHPDICTQDEFELRSIYMHCNKRLVSFNPIQKLMREYISPRLSVANIPIKCGVPIATIGASGNKKYLPHLHLQFEFTLDNQSVAISPLALYGLPQCNNLTKDIKDVQEFREFYSQHMEAMAPWKDFVK